MAVDYDRAFGDYSRQTLGEALSALGAPLPRRILDVACGTGLLIERLLELDPSVEIVGVDLSEEMLARARDRFAGRPRVTLAVGRAERLPTPDSSVDAIVIANAFHLVRDRPAALAECRRALVAEGRLILVDWCRDAWAMRLLALGLAATQRLRRDIVGLARQRRELEAAGFEVEEARRFRARPLWGLMVLRAHKPPST